MPEVVCGAYLDGGEFELLAGPTSADGRPRSKDQIKKKKGKQETRTDVCD